MRALPSRLLEILDSDRYDGVARWPVRRRATSGSRVKLARLMLQVGFRTLLERIPGLRLAVDEDDVVWQEGMILRGPARLEVAWNPGELGATRAESGVLPGRGDHRAGRRHRRGAGARAVSSGQPRGLAATKTA
ncbi:hypothetical protein AB0I53_10620 [Saccharopolyspora sp. NPDC050389]|uniref:hypothetical protein n=1 Tax=Saccharopolyspora sp. NPDC050389 TaxID=3155516 RepID=UPI0033E83ADE